MKLWCLNFNDFKEMALFHHWDREVPNDVAIISINDGKDNLKETDEYHICQTSENVLNLNFDDADPIANGLDSNITSYEYKGKTIEFFTDEQAYEAIYFIENNINKSIFSNIHFFIHCSAGISRSQAFVKYIKNIYNKINWETNPNNPCLHPNGFVYQKLMNAYRCRK